MHKSKFATLSGMCLAIVFAACLSPKLCIMRSLGLKHACFLRSLTPQPKKKVPASTQNVTDLDFVKPPSEGVLNNAKSYGNTRDSKKGSEKLLGRV